MCSKIIKANVRKIFRRSILRKFGAKFSINFRNDFGEIRIRKSKGNFKEMSGKC